MTTAKRSKSKNNLDLLRWYGEMGVEENTGEACVDRFSPAQEPRAGDDKAVDAGGAGQKSPSPAPLFAAEEQGDDTSARIESCKTIAELVGVLSAFDACPLKKTATNLVFCDGTPTARVMIVGEAPGRDEDLQGKPFVGRSGKLLDRMLGAIGLSRHDEDPAKSVFISNCIFWRPPGNRKPSEAETLMCLPFLERGIELVGPDILVALGATAAQRLLGTTKGIMRSRGQWGTYKTPHGKAITAIASLHPAYLLRQPAHKRLAWQDFLKIREALDETLELNQTSSESLS